MSLRPLLGVKVGNNLIHGYGLTPYQILPGYDIPHRELPMTGSDPDV